MSFQHGLTGIFAANRSLDVIGNNVANVNTVGFKGSRTEFSDMFANNLSGAAGNQAGIGVRAVSIAQQFAQGNISSTGNPLDLAISGRGFFRMENTSGAVSYSRAGQFRLDQYGYVVTNNGLKLTGYLADSSGSINPTAPMALKLDTSDISPRATGETAGMPGATMAGIFANVNLDAREAIISSGTTFDPATPASYTASTSLSVYDTQGNPHTATMYFVKRDPGSTVIPDPSDATGATPLTVAVSNWDVNITIQDTNFSGVSGGKIDFQDSSGILHSSSSTTYPQTPNDKYFSLRASFDSSGKLVAAGDLQIGMVANGGANVVHDPLRTMPLTLTASTIPAISASTYTTSGPITNSSGATIAYPDGVTDSSGTYTGGYFMADPANPASYRHYGVNGALADNYTYNFDGTSTFSPNASLSANASSSGKFNLPIASADNVLNSNVFSLEAKAGAPAALYTLTGLDIPKDGLVMQAQFAASKLNPDSGTMSSTSGLGVASGGIPFNIGNLTQFGSVFGVNALSQDGYASGRLASFSFDDKGVLLGRYTNGMSKNLAQLVLVNFANPQGLTPAGDNQWLETTASGNPLVGAPGSSNLGLIQSLGVEDSNVELTQELVSMITAQRAYQANAQTIKTQDQLMQTVLNLR